MEARKITVVSTRNQKKSVIMSAATTLAELKADFRQNGIEYDGMTFYEGTSKVELKDDASVLPHDVPYKGQTTNELVFMLTTPNKKIKSGADMTRAEAYIAIKANGLQEECIKRFGKNYTMCKTIDLITLINEKSVKDYSSETDSCKREKEIKKPNCECECDRVKAALLRLVTILSDNNTLDFNEEEEIKEILGGNVKRDNCKKNNTPESPYSNDEIDSMFDFAK